MSKAIIPVSKIAQSIHLLRGQKVMLDLDLAVLSGVETKVLNQAVKRNRRRFPEDFMFQLTGGEIAYLRSQFLTSKQQLIESKVVASNWSQFVTGPDKRGGVRYRPYAFTEQGVAMLSSVLKSERAVKVNIAIMRAFVNSGERTRHACWRWRPRHLGLFPPVAFLKARRGFSAWRRKEHAGRVRSPAPQRR